MGKTSGSFTPPLPRALSNTLMKISKSPQSPQSPQSERKKRNFFQRHLPGAAADAEQREGKGSPLSSPQVPNLIYQTTTLNKRRMDGKQEHKVSYRIDDHCHRTGELHFYVFFFRNTSLDRIYCIWSYGHMAINGHLRNTLQDMLIVLADNFGFQL